MKYLFLALLLTGCSTTVRSRNGVVLLSTSSDIGRLHFASTGGGESVVLDMDLHAPSKTIRAGGSVVGTTGSAIVGAAMAVGLKP